MTAYDALVAADGATHHWPCSEASGSTACGDLIGTLALARVVTAGAGPQLGQTGGPAGGTAIAIDNDGYLLSDVTAALAEGSAFSLEAWVNLAHHAGDTSTYLALADTGFSPAWLSATYENVPFGPDKVFWLATADFNDDGFLSEAYAGSDVAPDVSGAWHHLAAVYDGLAAHLYVDGVALTPLTQGSLLTGYPAEPRFSVGLWVFGSNFKGTVQHVAFYPLALSACQVLSHYHLATTGTYTPCHPWLRLVHASGQGFWQTRGDVIEEWADGLKRLLLPFPTMTPPAAEVLARDPLTGLPMWAEPPATTTSLPITPVVVPSPVPPVVPPAPGDPCVQTRCGAALALQTKLVRDYDQWRQWINAAISFAVGGLIASVLAEIAGLLAVAEVAAWVLQVFKLVSPIIQTATFTSLPSLIPQLSAPQSNKILQDFFCQMHCHGDAVAFNVPDQQAVAATLLADTTTFSSDLMRELLGEIVYYEPIQDWQAAMTNAPVSDFCDGITCP